MQPLFNVHPHQDRAVDGGNLLIRNQTGVALSGTLTRRPDNTLTITLLWRSSRRAFRLLNYPLPPLANTIQLRENPNNCNNPVSCTFIRRGILHTA